MKHALRALKRPAFALLIALVIGGVIIALVQKDIRAPFAAYAALASGAFGSASGGANTLRQTMPLLLTGMAVYVALAAGLFNIGAEGQMAMGGLAAAVAGYSFKGVLPAPLLLLTACVLGCAVGAAWAFLPAFLRVKRGVHEVITAILLNYVAQSVTRYLAAFPLKDPAGQAPQTAEVGAVLPRLLAAYDVHLGLIIALIAASLFAGAIHRTIWGYETRAVGQGAGAAEAAGIPTDRVRIRALLISGAIAGLAGAILILGEVPFRRFPADFYGIGYGFDGLAVALLAGSSAWGVLPAALLFGALNAGAEAMTFAVGTPKQVVQIVQAILIIAVAARAGLRVSGFGLRKEKQKREGSPSAFPEAQSPKPEALPGGDS